MSDKEGYGWTLLTADNPIIHDAIVLKRVHVCATKEEGEVILYHGHSSTGRVIHRIRVGNYGHPTLDYNIRLPDGLYVDIYQKVRHVLVIWTPLAK